MEISFSVQLDAGTDPWLPEVLPQSRSLVIEKLIGLVEGYLKGDFYWQRDRGYTLPED